MFRGFSKVVSIVAFAFSVGFLLVAAIHRSMLNTEYYVTWGIVYIEMAFSGLSILACIGVFFCAIYCLIRKEFKQTLLLLAVIVIVLALNGASCVIDSPTLLYAT